MTTLEQSRPHRLRGASTRPSYGSASAGDAWRGRLRRSDQCAASAVAFRNDDADVRRARREVRNGDAGHRRGAVATHRAVQQTGTAADNIRRSRMK